MKATFSLPRRASYADYLAVEHASAHRHELIDGVIVAMAGGSDEHNAIGGRIAMVLGQRSEIARPEAVTRPGSAPPVASPDPRPWPADVIY